MPFNSCVEYPLSIVLQYFMDVEVRYGAEVLACRAALEIYDALD